MIIAKGTIYDTKQQDDILEHIEDEIIKTLSEKSLHIETVLSAIETLCKKLQDGDFDDIIQSLSIDNADMYKHQAIKMLSRENILFKLKTELGENFLKEYETEPPRNFTKIRIKTRPLGVLLHIAAGNIDGLPAFSLAEGLLTGNINILKLPSADNGLSVRIVAELINAEPSLADFIYVFDTPSTDIAAISKMANISDGIIVWGSEAAVSAVRNLAPVNAKLIEWGHKLSFAYISGYEDKENELNLLAEHIITTKGLLCSSCQVIYIDTDNFEEVTAFCREFFPVLEKSAKKHLPSDIGSRAEMSLRRYADKLESFFHENKKDMFNGEFCSLVPKTDSELELSDMFGSVLVKPLPGSDIVKILRKKRGFLQTAGLICEAKKRKELSEMLSRCGMVRITRAGDMSSAFSGEAHDGEYPLRRYIRVVNEQI